MGNGKGGWSRRLSVRLFCGGCKVPSRRQSVRRLHSPQMSAGGRVLMVKSLDCMSSRRGAGGAAGCVSVRRCGGRIADRNPALGGGGRCRGWSATFLLLRGQMLTCYPLKVEGNEG